MKQRAAKQVHVEAANNAETLEALEGLFGAARYIASNLNARDKLSLGELFDAIALAQLTVLRLKANGLSD